MAGDTVSAGGDTLATRIGANADGVVAGKNNEQHSSQVDGGVVVNTGWGNGQWEDALFNQFAQQNTDIKIIYSMLYDLRNQMTQMQGWVVVMGLAVTMEMVVFLIFLLFTHRL